MATGAEAFEHAVVGMAIVGLDGRCLRVNRALREMLGHAPAALGEICQPDDPGHGERLVEVGAAPARWVRFSRTLIRDDAGAPMHFLVQAQDVSELRRTEQALRERDERLCSLDRLSSDWFWQQDAELRFTSIADQEREQHFEGHDVVGLRRWELPDVMPLTTSWDEHRRLLAQRQPFRDFTYLRRLASGAPSYVKVSGEPVFDDAGQFRGYRGTARDITDSMLVDQKILQLNAELEERVRRRTEDLQAANRELESFSYSIAHDLRAPLASIDGFSRMLEQQAGQAIDGRNLHYLRRIRAAVRHMSELTEGLLSMSRLARASLRREPVDLALLARDALDACLQQAPGRQVEVAIAPSLPAEGDPRLLAQVMGNLVGNAWKFTERTAQARIEVGMEHGDDGQPVFFVRDNGAGFDMAYAGRLFEAFERLHAPTEFEGTGIGLAIVHRIVDRHGGRVWAEAAPGQGACFRFTLPGQRSPLR